MRIELILWWVVLLLGFGTYYLGYAAPSLRGNITR
jgi:hypothetical protein